MDKITTTLLREFADTEGLETLSEPDAFVRFTNYAIVSKEYSDTFNVEDVTTDGDNDTGLDGVAIIVNGALVTDSDDIDQLIDTNSYLDATFIFVQSKTSSNFNGAEMSNFAFGVKDFFEDQPKLPRNQAVADLANVQAAIYARASKMTRRKPDVQMHYVTTGKWQDDNALNARTQTAVSDLVDTGLFNNVVFEPVDANRIQDLYRATKSKASAEFRFTKRITLPDMDSVKEAYLGILPALEYVRLIEDTSGEIRKTLFYDNVRDFQDYNEVNKDIRETLRSAAKNRFILLNNGVTILAKEMRSVGDTIHIEDYQVVNGCQTSHVLFDCKDTLTESVYVPLKVIVTEDDHVTSEVITATNRQTEVKPDQLYAMSAFQKRLEEFFNTYDGAKRLYYERRTRQYATVSEVKKVRVVPIQLQMRVFAAMFMNEPHRGHYPTSLRQFVGTKIFHKDHRLEPYYTSAFAQYKLEALFRNGTLDTTFKPARFHLLQIARHIAGGNSPAIHANAMEQYCETVCKTLWDDDKASELFEAATEFISTIVGKRDLNRDLTKTQPFSQEVREALDAY